MSARTDSLAVVLQADIASLEARLGAHRYSLRRSVRVYHRALREPGGHKPQLSQARAAMHHDKEMLRIHSRKLAEARTRLAQHLAACPAA